MKKLIAILLCAMLLTLPVLSINMTAPKATINLDGVRDDAYGDPIEIKYFNDAPGATGKAWAAWDDSYIYLFFEVADKTPNHEHNNHYERDCVEVFFDWYNGKDDDTSEDEAHPYWQLRYSSAPNADGDQFSVNVNWASLGWDNSAEEKNIAGNSVVKLVDGGYIIEARVPYKQFGLKVGEGSVIGADFMIGDNQEDAGRTSMTFPDPDFTSNNQYSTPSELGVLLTLSGAAAPAWSAPNLKIGGGTTVIKATDFDSGVYGKAPADGAKDIRPAEDVNTENGAGKAGEVGGNIGWIGAGDWVQYTVNVDAAGTYGFSAWIASDASPTGNVEVYVGDKLVGASEKSLKKGWQEYSLFPVGNIDLAAGSNVIKVVFPSGGLNFCALEVVQGGIDVAADVVEAPPAPATKPAPPVAVKTGDAGVVLLVAIMLAGVVVFGKKIAVK